jgi:1-hydroxycarotenoid 3,4-desaturase
LPPASVIAGAEIVVVGAGVGGLSAALSLAGTGACVTVVEAQECAGGKLRSLDVSGAAIDSGPTVLTMPNVFKGLFEQAGLHLSNYVTVRPSRCLARHFWPDGSQLDLFADLQESAAAVARFAGAREARGYLDFSRRAEDAYLALKDSFMAAPAPSATSLTRSGGIGAMFKIAPFRSLDAVIGDHFRDRRLRQLFGRYATYCGGSPYQAPGPLMTIAHVERAGVYLVEGGMVRLAEGLAQACRDRGVRFLMGSRVKAIEPDPATGFKLHLGDGRMLDAHAVIHNGDPSKLSIAGRSRDTAAAVCPRKERSLSAVTLSLTAIAEGVDLVRHNVFFSSDARREFSTLFDRRAMPDKPTLYVCAQDRDDDGLATPGQPERLFILANAPANGDDHVSDDRERQQWQATILKRLAEMGLTLREVTCRVTMPSDFEALFPGSGGALYGAAPNGAMSSFRRPKVRTAVPFLYQAGGAIHPGPGLPMVALSGINAAQAARMDLASMSMSAKTAIAGGTSTPRATMASMR